PFTHSIVSPTFTCTSRGEKARSLMVTRTISPAEDGAADRATISPASTRKHILRIRLVQLACEMLGVLLVALEDLEAGLQQALQLGVGRRRNQRGRQRIVDRLVIG